MSRGRKRKGEINSLNWEQLFFKNVSSYFPIIISELGKLNQEGNENGLYLLQKVKNEISKKGLKTQILPSITKKEIPYQTPKNWVWCRLGEITNYGSSLRAERSDLSDDTWVLDLEDIEKTSSTLLAKIKFKDRKSLSTKSRFTKGDILYSKLRPYLDKVIVADEDGVCTTEILPLKCFGGINPQYLRYSLKRGDFLKYVNSVTKGMKMPRLGTYEGRMALIPLPPVSEQIPIVAFLEDFQNNNLKQEGHYFNIEVEKKIIALHRSQLLASEIFTETNIQLTQLENLNQAILQEAVQGKLVAQNPDDEPASELLKRIKAEKAISVKKERPLPPIKSEEIPFGIPENWVWCRLGEICSKIGSGSTPKGSNYAKSGFPFFRSQNIYNDRLVYDDMKFVSDEVQKQMNGTIVLGNDILLNITGGSMGRCALVPEDFEEGNVSQHVCIIRPIEVDRNYFHKIVLSPYFQKFIFSSTTGAGREGLPKYNLERFVIPLPPLSEQKRIVAEIEKQFAKTKQLKEHIIANQKATEQLLKALLHRAFEVKEENTETIQQVNGKVVESDTNTVNWNNLAAEPFEKYAAHSVNNIQDIDWEMAMMVACMKSKLGVTYGDVGLQKNVYNTNNLQPIFSKQYAFANSNFGTYCHELKEDLKRNPYLIAQKVANNKEVYAVNPKYSKQVLDKLSAPENKEFIQAVNRMLSIYEHPFINKETDKIELYNTVLKVALDKDTRNIDNIYQGMKDWKINQIKYKTKAEKFSKPDAERMLQLLIEKKIL